MLAKNQFKRELNKHSAPKRNENNKTTDARKCVEFGGLAEWLELHEGLSISCLEKREHTLGIMGKILEERVLERTKDFVIELSCGEIATFRLEIFFEKGQYETRCYKAESLITQPPIPKLVRSSHRLKK